MHTFVDHSVFSPMCNYVHFLTYNFVQIQVIGDIRSYNHINLDKVIELNILIN